MGGSKSRKTSSGSRATAGAPGISPSTSPPSTRKMGYGIAVRSVIAASAATAASRTKTSSTPCTVRLLLPGLLAVLLVSNVHAPGHGAARVVRLLHRDVDHEPVRSGAVPMILAGVKEDAVAGADLFDGGATALAAADALGDVDRLAEWVGVPGRACPRREVD